MSTIPDHPIETEGPPILTVAEITSSMKELIEEVYPTVRIVGEVSNLKRPASGHAYFTLKDDRAQLRTVLFRGTASRLTFQPQDGMEVVATGQLTIYERRGDYQLIVSQLRPSGVGALHKAFEELKRRLAAEGLFDREKKKKIPELPQTVGVVTSATGAAFQDILNVMGRRFHGIRIVIRPTPVQGDNAAREIAQAIEAFNEWGEADVLIVGRGGGSLEDLWSFNEEIVARAIAASSIPVISAVGHEIDFTISDLTADVRAPTPSAAAEIVVGEREAYVRRVDTASTRLRKGLENLTKEYRSRFDLCLVRPALSRPELWIAPLAQDVDFLGDRLRNSLGAASEKRHRRVELAKARLGLLAPTGKLKRSGERLGQDWSSLCASFRQSVRTRRLIFAQTKASLQALSPRNVLDRGFCLAYESSTRDLLTKAAKGEEGQDVAIVFSDGEWNCSVDRVVIPKREDAP